MMYYGRMGASGAGGLAVTLYLEYPTGASRRFSAYGVLGVKHGGCDGFPTLSLKYHLYQLYNNWKPSWTHDRMFVIENRL